MTEKPTTKQLITLGLSLVAAAGIAGTSLNYCIKELKKQEQEGIEYVAKQEMEKKEKQNIRNNLEQEARAEWKRYSKEPINEVFLSNLIFRESTNNPRAVSKVGARGLMQIMGPTWKEVTKELYGKEISYDLAFNPEINKKVGIAYLEKLDNILSTNLEGYVNMDIEDKQRKIAGAYNGGITRLLRNEGEISLMPKETREYVKAIVDQ